jgi:hypothetical protein
MVNDDTLKTLQVLADEFESLAGADNMVVVALRNAVDLIERLPRDAVGNVISPLVTVWNRSCDVPAYVVYLMNNGLVAVNDAALWSSNDHEAIGEYTVWRANDLYVNIADATAAREGER